jgi:hypothetical protein
MTRGLLSLVVVVVLSACASRRPPRSLEPEARAAETEASRPVVNDTTKIERELAKEPEMRAIRVEAAAQFVGETLHVSYAITNLERVPVYVFDVAFGPSATLRKDFARVSYEAPATVVLTSALSAPPPGVAWAAPPSAYAIRIGPGETVRRERQHTLPLRATEDAFALPPMPGTAAPMRETKCDHLKLVLGYVVEISNLGVAPEPSVGDDVYRLRASVLDKQQRASIQLENVDLLLVHP